MNSLIKSKALILFTNSFPFGNSETYLHNELPYLMDAFDKIYIFPINKKGDLTQSLPSKVNVISHDVFFESISLNYTTIFRELFVELPKLISLPKPIHQIKYFTAYLTHKYKLAQIAIKTIGIKKLEDSHSICLYSYWFNDLAVISSFIMQQFNQCQTISRAHGFDLFEEQSLHNYIPFRAMQFKYIQKVVSVSKRGEDYLKQRFPENAFKISTSYLGTDSDEYMLKNLNPTFSIATCSVIRNIKRLDLLVDVLKCVDFEMNWHVIGNGTEFESLKQKCKELPAQVKVLFHGYLKQDELYDFYRNTPINLFCSVSSSEGLPVSMMEAISFGIPVMSTDVGGCSEICNNETGFLIPKDFISNEVADQIAAFKDSKKNTLNFRAEVRKYWERNFAAKTNYSNFVNTILLN